MLLQSIAIFMEKQMGHLHWAHSKKELIFEGTKLILSIENDVTANLSFNDIINKFSKQKARKCM